MPQAFVVNGLVFGDEGKGTIVDALTRQFKIPYNVRYNGGAQAAHNVLLPDGRHHTFSTFGSGTLQGAKTILSQHVLVDPVKIGMERDALRRLGIQSPESRLYIDENALLVTPYHVARNRFRSEPGTTCGLGIGECMQDFLNRGEAVLRVKDLRNLDVLTEKMKSLQAELKRDIEPYNLREPQHYYIHWIHHPVEETVKLYYGLAASLNIYSSEAIRDLMVKASGVIFEGAQGALLDENYGFHPYTTWSTTTPKNALQLCSDWGITPKVIGVMRTFMTRHGAGPMPSEHPMLSRDFEDVCNPQNPWQGQLRAGCLDIPLLDYAIRACGQVDALAVTHVDTAKSYSHFMEMRVGYQDIDFNLPTNQEEQISLTQKLMGDPRYDFYPFSTGWIIEEIEELLKRKALIQSSGRTCLDKFIHTSL